MKKILMTAGLLISIASSYAQAESFFGLSTKTDSPIENISIKCGGAGGAILISEKNEDIRHADSFNDLVGYKLADVTIEENDPTKHLISFKAKFWGEDVTGETSIVNNDDGSEQLVLNYLDQTMQCEVVK